MSYRNATVALCLTIALSALSATASADPVAEAGRQLLDTNKEAVVTVRLVVREQLTMQGRSGEATESTSEVTGTVISPDGVTVLSLSETDPGALFNMMGMGMEGVSIDSEVTDVQLIQLDGAETPAQLILRDQDFDLAFVRPTEQPESDWPYIDLDQDGSPELLDQAIMLNRLGRVAGRNHSAGVIRIESIVERPRQFYIPSRGETGASLGSPVFTLEGDIVGIMVLRAIRGTGGGVSRMLRSGDTMTPIVLPAIDIREAVEQAPERDEVDDPDKPVLDLEDDEAEDEADDSQ